MTTGSPWFRATNPPEPEPEQQRVQQVPVPRYQEAAYGEAAYETVYEPETAAYEPTAPPSSPEPHEPYERSYAESYEQPYERPYDQPHDETMALRTVEPAATPLPGPGRAERRRAAKGRGGRRGGTPSARPEQAAEAPAAPLSRVEARRAARARKESVGVVASRVVGELFITFGVVMLLFVTYQLWWTNVRAGQQTDRAKEQIEDAWSKGRAPGAFEPGQGFAIMYIPKLDVVVPVAEGISKPKVLDRGMVGHYAEGTLKTAMPSDKQGNFAVAGHRNTHGEPFRYINQLEPGDPIVVETQDAYYTYEMASILPQTAPSNVSVIDPVPRGSGFTGPGRYITLTTCTPEFTSTYRMIVWGKMVEERPRSKGKPDALVG
ncbi:MULTISPECIES: class E sortase [Streptomyces]|uniref:class E sortase n=1 Tax=Streptomyces TaxID=1883 RepID=UPI0016753A7C|nr:MULTISPECIES: class E sortase [Streptomyces]GGT68581.1 class E sortase [Streptomyces lateritius]